MQNEDNRIEYKRELNSKVKREIVSFLNTNGGTIYLGVDDETRQPLTISESKRHEWEEKLSQWYTTAFYPTPFSLIEINPNDDIFNIKVKPGRHKPYAINGEGFTPQGVYVRNGSSAVKASNELIKRMIQQNQGNDEFDSEQSPNQILTFVELEKTALGKKIEFNPKALRMLNKSNVYNNAALLVSDQNPIITKLAIYDGTTVMNFKDKREFSGPLTTQLDELMYFIDLNNHTKIKIDGSLQRHEVRDYPVTAIRESIVNAFAHRDYLLHSTIKVEIFDDRMEILSPGGIPDGLTLEEVKTGMTAVRNPQLVHILDKLKYIENYGTGIRRIYESYQQTIKSPEFSVNQNSFKVTLPNINWNHPVQIKPIVVQNGRRVTENDVLSLLSQHQQLTNKQIQATLGISPYHARKLLLGLIQQGKVVKLGASVNTVYQKLNN